ncbi:P-loop containing nucleoside triphosphate hydrolase protein [Gorgonomyces haynaldii]|nr:P-loop containing nucleoside triphosphate hydrolase protein [Gorgonomyces haynaldii]
MALQKIVKEPWHKFLQKGQQFVDFKRIGCFAGKGGDGHIAFARTSYQPMGPPSGGNGGAGGSIYIRACKNTTSLNGILNRYVARQGEDGSRQAMHGKNARDVEIVVPLGTIPEQPRIKIDLLEDGQKIMVCKGGIGGLGNPHFVTPLMPGPGIASKGEHGQVKFIQLELKTLADAGLVGLPNAGKSTLLKAVSNCHPRIAPYPFTTLNPYVGTIDFPDFWSMTIADMPGIIKGAHQNHGLGHRFLRHIERNQIFVYVVDLASEAPWDDLKVLQDELEQYKPGLTQKPSIVCANKADIAESARTNLEILKQKTHLPIVPVSAKNEKNIHTLTGLMRQLVENSQKLP